VNEATLQRLLGHYLDETVTGFEQITIGVSNEAFTVTCESGERYVIRILDEQTADSAEAEGRIQQALARSGISTPLYLSSAVGPVVGRDGDRTFTVAGLIEGHHPEVATPGLVESLGRQLARLHDALDPAEVRIGFNSGQWFDPRKARVDLAQCLPDAAARVGPLLESSVAIFDLALPMAVIHGELATNNVFAEGDEVTTIFDFETAQHAPRLFDMAYTYISVVYDDVMAPATVIDRVVSGYDSAATTPLTAAERDAFTRAVRFVCASAAIWCFARQHDDHGERFLYALEDIPAMP
jgi:Ser/Thr protein kinase RdoA (MazF antagonist)